MKLHPPFAIALTALATLTIALFASRAPAESQKDAAASTIEYTSSVTLHLEVLDRAEAVKWFAEKLEFRHLFSVDEMNWSEVATKTPGLTIGMQETPTPRLQQNAIAIGVSNIDKARATLEARGVHFDGPILDFAPVRITHFKDPSGNLFELYQGK